MGMAIHHSDQAMGTLGGTLIAFIGIVDGSDIIKTGILACVGAMVSFGVSKGLHKIFPADVVFPIKKEKSGILCTTPLKKIVFYQLNFVF